MTRLLRALPVLVAVLAFMAFLPALDGAFLNWDDDRNFLWNTGYRGLGPAQLRWMFTATWMGHYIPLTWLSLGLNYVLDGMAPWGYHLGNLLIHAANAGVLFFVARRLLRVATVPTLETEQAAIKAELADWHSRFEAAYDAFAQFIQADSHPADQVRGLDRPLDPDYTPHARSAPVTDLTGPTAK